MQRTTTSQCISRCHADHRLPMRGAIAPSLKRADSPGCCARLAKRSTGRYGRLIYQWRSVFRTGSRLALGAYGPHGSVIYIDRWLCAACGPCVKEPGVEMRFGFIASFAMAILAIVGVFIDIPIVSQYAFWFVVGAYILLAGSRW